MMDETQRADRPTAFVTIVAWTSIVFSGFATVGAAALVVVVAWLYADDAMSATIDDVLEHGELTPPLQRLIENLPMWTVGALVATVASLVISIDLLRRRPWARPAFVGVLVVVAVAHVVGPLAMLPFTDLPLDPNAPMAPFLDRFAKNILWLNVAAGIAFVPVFAWIGRRLYTEPVTCDFEPI